MRDFVVVACLLVIIFTLSQCVSPEVVIAIDLLTDVSDNESIVLNGYLNSPSQSCFFIIDTAYAGPPVLSLHYLAIIERRERRKRRFWTDKRKSMAYDHRCDTNDLSQPVTKTEQDSAFLAFKSRSTCRSFTSGCTMRLIGIGETSEIHSDLILCPFRPVLSGRFGAHSILSRSKIGEGGDVFVTNPLPNSLHIITSDFLLHRSPCLIEISTRKLHFHIDASRLTHEFDVFDTVFTEGGAIVIPVEIGGRVMRIIIDTGASVTLAVSKSIEQIIVCSYTTETRVMQQGIHGESVCSNVVQCDLQLGRHKMPNVDVLINSHEINDSDGYMGMGILRMFDIYISHEHIAFRRNHNLHRSVSTFSVPGSCSRRPSHCSRRS